MSTVIRPAGPVDASRLTVLMREFYEHEQLQYGPNMSTALGALLGDRAVGRAWLFEREDADAGYMILTWGYSLEFGDRLGLVDELYVRPGFRGGGLGRRALETATVACRAAGASAVRLEVDHGNAHAVRLYGRVGFLTHERHIMTHVLDVVPSVPSGSVQ